MNALVAKEVRLVLPAYGVALLLAVVPVWLLPGGSSNTPPGIPVFPLWLGATILALSSFGREFGLQTFPLMLAQPVERRRMWWTKIAVLAGALATVFGLWCLALSCWATVHTALERRLWHESLMIGGLAAAVTFAGGLWTTLLLRQVSAAFWFTILVPGAILTAIGINGESGLLVVAALGLYSVAGSFWARRQFFRAQEVAWTGGVIAFPGWRAAKAGARASNRAHRPLAALVWKELQLHQVGLLGMGGLFVLHLGVVALLKTGHDALGDTTRSALGLFGGVWLIVPFLAGSPSVAEERKLGTMDGHLCLPISTRVQFAIKLLIVLVLGGLLSPVLLWIAEGISNAVDAGSGMGLRPVFGGQPLVMLSLVCLALALVGFYASTVARNIVQALAVAVVTTLMLGMLMGIAPNPESVTGLWLWQGDLVHYLAWPTLTVAFVWLAYRNFRSGSERWHLWRRNALGLAGALLLIIGSTSALYHRAWELLLPLEPAHGPARLVGPTPTSLHVYGSSLRVRLPDGRVWADGIRYEPGPLFLEFGRGTGFRVGGKWTSQSHHHFLASSNWTVAVSSYGGTVGIRSDGTLWVSEAPRPRWDGKGKLPVQEPAQTVPFGSETNWQDVVREYPWSVLFLKQDGTLWRWGTNSFSDKLEWPGLQAFQPQRLGTKSDWARILRGINCIYAWERDGRAWAIIYSLERKLKNREAELDPSTFIERCSYLDDFTCQSLAQTGRYEEGVREDGTLWTWPRELQSGTGRSQIGRDTDWVAVAGDFGRLVAVKKDGSLWKWDAHDMRGPHFSPPPASPVRLSTHRDWVAVSEWMDGIVSLAADGTLWHWTTPGQPYFPGTSGQPLLAGSRRPVRIANIFDD